MYALEAPNPAEDSIYQYMGENSQYFYEAQVQDVSLQGFNLTGYDNYLYLSRKVDPFRLGSFYSVDTSQSTDIEFTGVYVFANSTAFQAAPTFASEYALAAINNISNPQADAYYKLKFYNFPLPLTSTQQNLAQNLGGPFIICIFACGMAHIPIGLVTFIVKERENSIKHQHLVSGVSIPAYWASAFVWDLIKYQIPGIIIPLMIKGFDLKSLTEPTEVYNGIWALFFMFGFAIIPYTYTVSFLFKSHSIAMLYICALHLIIGSLGALDLWLLLLISDLTREVQNALAYPLRIASPIFCLSFGLIKVSNRVSYQFAYGLSSEPGVYDWNIAGVELFFMFLHAVLGSILVFMIEWLSTCTFFRNLVAVKDPGPNEFVEDEDVERMRVEALNSSPGDVAVKVSGLRKIYGNIFNKSDVKIAVQEASFVVHPQQAFALLGVNGAGKSTCFRILTGESGPTSGEIFISGYNVVNDLAQARYNTGYCPQFDALSEVLTPVEHLELYARIKGIPKNLISRFVDKQIKDMVLEKYANVRAENLSGGNKRQLSVAIATIGNPPVVFLDEPSAGMDPNARKNMWEVVNRIKRQKCSIILTTHSMDEAESLCNTMAIMVEGRFKCYGTAAHIKNKYSSGYEFLLKVLCPITEEIDKLVAALAGFTVNENVSQAHVAAALTSVGAEYLFEQIADHESGAHLHEELKERKQVDVRSLAEWVLLESIGSKIFEWLIVEFKEVRLIEHYGSYYKFKLEKAQNFSIGFLFGKIEEVKMNLMIQEYSLSQATLEQIFNMFVTEGENSKAKKRMRERYSALR